MGYRRLLTWLQNLDVVRRLVVLEAHEADEAICPGDGYELAYSSVSKIFLS